MQPIWIVDDDPSIRFVLEKALARESLPTRSFSNPRDVLAALGEPDMPGPSVLVSDIRMPGGNGLELLSTVKEKLPQLPVIVMTGHGDVDSARQAFRAQAVDFVEKPIDHDRLMRAIEEAFARQRSQRDNRDRNAESAGLLAALTPREAEVMEQVVAGQHNREIARKLGISPRTVEVHKARLLAKLRVSSIADLVRLSMDVRKAGRG